MFYIKKFPYRKTLFIVKHQGKEFWKAASNWYYWFLYTIFTIFLIFFVINYLNEMAYSFITIRLPIFTLYVLIHLGILYQMISLLILVQALFVEWEKHANKQHVLRFNINFHGSQSSNNKLYTNVKQCQTMLLRK